MAKCSSPLQLRNTLNRSGKVRLVQLPDNFPLDVRLRGCNVNHGCHGPGADSKSRRINGLLM